MMTTTGAALDFAAEMRVRIASPGYLETAVKDVSRKRAERMAQRERAVGLEPDDEAAAWLAENAPEPEPPRPKAASKSKLLHQFRKRR